MISRIIDYVEKHHMINTGDTVVAGVSGGADSVCLLFVLSELQKMISFKLMVVHVNHLIRDNASEDADYVKRLCEDKDIPFYLVEKNVSAIAKERKLSEEEAGRMIRYEAFEKQLQNEDFQAVKRHKAKIAVAHNLNDRAETMLFHLCRGSGINGLASIRPVKARDGKPDIIRPLLSVSRIEIEDYLIKQGISWQTDCTNEEDTYTRNRIRHHVLPYIENEISEGAVSHMGRAADILSETEDFIQKETGKAYKECVSLDGDTINVDGLLSYHPLLQKQIILCVLKKLTPALKDITATHIESVLSLFYKEANRQVDLPYDILVKRSYDEVHFMKKGGKSTFQSDAVQMNLPKPGEESKRIFLPNGEIMEFRVFECEKSANIVQNPYTKWFDYDKIVKSLTVRTRRTKDYLTINEANSKKTIQDYMVDEKIPKENRDKVWLLAEDSHILWVVGHRISHYYKIDKNTKYILQVQYRGGQ